MDGELDYALSERLGWDLEKKLQKIIKELPEGELLVGQASLPLQVSASIAAPIFAAVLSPYKRCISKNHAAPEY
jgi:hypothetical protein